MSVTNDQLRKIDQALAQLRRMPARPKLSFRIAHTINLLTPSFEALNKQEIEIRKKHIMTDALGAEIRNGDDFAYNEGSSLEKLELELRELFETETGVELPIGRFVEKDFDEAQFPLQPDVLIKLGPLVKFDEPANVAT